MTRPLILMPQHPNLEPDVLAIARERLPADFTLDVVPRHELPARLPAADYLLGFVGRLPAGAIRSARRLRLIQLLSAGFDNVDLDAARAAGVPVAVNGGANAVAVAEHAIMLMLATLKHLTELNAAVHVGAWRGAQPRLYELGGSTVGIVGMGNIGQAVARRLMGWEANKIYHDPVRLQPQRERDLDVAYRELPDLLAEADVVTVHVPLEAGTRGLVGAGALARLKPTAVLVNTSRGEVVDEAALVAALRERRLLGASLDVFAEEPPPFGHPLFGLPNVVLTPHMAGPTWQSWPRRFANGFANIERVHRGDAPLWTV